MQINELMSTVRQYLTTLFIKKGWVALGFDENTGAFILVPDSSVMKQVFHLGKNNKGIASFTQVGTADVEEVVFQIQFNNPEEVQKLTEGLFRLRMEMVLQNTKDTLPCTDMADLVDDLEYDQSNLFLDYDRKYRQPVCVMETASGEIARFKSIQDAAKYMKMKSTKLKRILEDGILSEIPVDRKLVVDKQEVTETKYYQVRYDYDINTFVPKEIIKMVNYTQLAREERNKINKQLHAKKAKIDKSNLEFIEKTLAEEKDRLIAEGTIKH